MKLTNLILLISLIACGCFFKSRGASTEGETHWLKSCQEGSACGDNGTCICGVCTTGCKKNTDCKDHDERAVCADSVVTALAEGCSGEEIALSTRLCVLPCDQNDDCTIDDAEMVCASDLCIDTDHQLAKKRSDNSCPENPNFQCSDRTPRDTQIPDPWADENGCLKRECTRDKDCLAGEACFVSADYGNCFRPWVCEDTENGCECNSATGPVTNLPFENACTTGYCVAPEAVTQCPNEVVSSDPIDVLDSYIEGDLLTLSVGHGGGCATHGYGLCTNGNTNESDPVQMDLQLIHDSGGDNCEAYLTEELHFDLSLLKKNYQQNYQTDAGLIETQFGLYGFGSMSCDYRNRLAGEKISQAGDKADTSCAVDEDCVVASNSITDCSYACGRIVSKNGEVYLANRLRIIEEGVCGDAEADGCSPPMPSCVSFEPLACVDGTCVSATGADPNPDAPRQLTTIGEPGPDTVAFHLYVSNQSFAIDPVDMDIRIDGVQAVQGEFRVEQQHNWYGFDFYLTFGDHGISATTEMGDAVQSWIFSLSSDEYWAVIDFATDPEGNSDRGFFDWTIQDTPIYFQ